MMERAIGPWSCDRADVLPVQEPHEIAGVHRFDLAPQAPEGHSVDARQNTPVAPLDLAAKRCGRRREAAAQHLPFGFEPKQRRLHHLAGQGES